MNQEKKLGVYMDFLRSNPNLRFQKKNRNHRGPVISMSKKLNSYKCTNDIVSLICDMSLTNIREITYSGTYNELQRQMPLRNALLEFLSLLHYRDYIDIVTKLGRGVSGRFKTPKSERSTNVESGRS